MRETRRGVNPQRGMGNNTLTLVVVALVVIARVVVRITYEQIIHPSALKVAHSVEAAFREGYLHWLRAIETPTSGV